MSYTIKEYIGFRIRWDLTILILILITFLIIPFQIAFQHQVHVIGSIIIYSIDLFFLVDIILNFRTSFRYAGEEITSSRELSRHYLRTNFSFDLIATLPFDALFFLLPGLEWEGISIILWLRLFRLIRIWRLFLILQRWQNQNWTNPGYLRVLRFLLVMVILAHIVACSWYFSSFIAGFPAESWTVLSGIANSDVVTKYIRSLYWTVTTLTAIGYGDIVPHLNYEYVFVILVMVTGALMYAYIIGNIASLISNLDARKSAFRLKLEDIELYLKQRSVQGSLNERVRNYYEYLWVHHRGQDENLLFSDLPDPLRLELMIELTKHLLKNVALFKYSSDRLRHVLLMALKPRTFDPGSVIARAGDTGNEIFFISKGSIDIVDENQEKKYFELTRGDYFGILSIMTRERRTATAISKGFSEIFVLSLEDFREIKEAYPEFSEVLKKVSSEKSEKTADMILEGIVL